MRNLLDNNMPDSYRASMDIVVKSEREIDLECAERLREHMKWMHTNFAGSDTIASAVGLIGRTIQNIEARHGN